MATLAKVPLLGVLPIEPRIQTLAQSGVSIIKEHPETTSAAVFKQIVRMLCGMDKFAD